MKAPRSTAMYKLLYMRNGRVVEVIEDNKPQPILRAKKRKLLIEGNHSLGLLILKRIR